jgi:hypothetical protein
MRARRISLAWCPRHGTTRLASCLWRWIVHVSGVTSIEKVDGGYGKGFVRAVEEMNKAIDLLRGLVERRGMHAIVISHQITKTAKDPTSDDYERLALALHEKTASAWEGAVDTILYAEPELKTYDTLNEGKNNERRKVDLTGRTLAIVRPGRGVAAGSRDLLRSPLILSWPTIELEAAAGNALRRQVFERRRAMTTEDQAALDRRLAAAGHSFESYEKEVQVQQ